MALTIPIALIDLDNLYIINNKVNIKALRRRIAYLKSVTKKIYWFGNAFTADLVQKYNIEIDVISTKVEVNSADHTLINFIGKLQARKVQIVSGDTTLQRIAKFLYPDRNLTFARFTDHHILETVTVDFKFKTKKQLEKFVISLRLYAQRFS